ncbi:MAG TPA: hypothetical protein VGF86_08735 [Candidatus Tumulicola sp.]|jgi:hypothetical protein
MDERRFRFDLLVALLALLISGVAAGASAYQTYVIRQQFSATVWPYLTFITSSGEGVFELSVSNAGIGPALIRSALVTRDGKPILVPSNPTAQPALALAVKPERLEAQREESKSKKHGKTSLTVSSILRGDVVPAGAKLQLLRVDGSFLARHVIADARRIDVRLCYCSLLGNCWTKRLWDPAAEPHPVGACT